MEPNKTFSKIKDLGHNSSKREELREFCKLKIDQVIKFLPRRILNSDGADILDCILNGLSDSSSPNKIKVMDIVLKTMRSESTSLTHCGDVISRICLEIPRQPTVELVKWCNDSVQSIVDNSDVNMIKLLWGSAAEMNTIFIIQRRAIRAMYNIGALNSLRDVFKEIGILTVPS